METYIKKIVSAIIVVTFIFTLAPVPPAMALRPVNEVEGKGAGDQLSRDLGVAESAAAPVAGEAKGTGTIPADRMTEFIQACWGEDEVALSRFMQIGPLSQLIPAAFVPIISFTDCNVGDILVAVPQRKGLCNFFEIVGDESGRGEMHPARQLVRLMFYVEDDGKFAYPEAGDEKPNIFHIREAGLAQETPYIYRISPDSAKMPIDAATMPVFVDARARVFICKAAQQAAKQAKQGWPGVTVGILSDISLGQLPGVKGKLPAATIQRLVDELVAEGMLETVPSIPGSVSVVWYRVPAAAAPATGLLRPVPPEGAGMGFAEPVGEKGTGEINEDEIQRVVNMCAQEYSLSDTAKAAIELYLRGGDIRSSIKLLSAEQAQTITDSEPRVIGDFYAKIILIAARLAAERTLYALGLSAIAAYLEAINMKGATPESNEEAVNEAAQYIAADRGKILPDDAVLLEVMEILSEAEELFAAAPATGAAAVGVDALVTELKDAHPIETLLIRLIRDPDTGDISVSEMPGAIADFFAGKTIDGKPIDASSKAAIDVIKKAQDELKTQIAQKTGLVVADSQEQADSERETLLATDIGLVRGNIRLAWTQEQIDEIVREGLNFDFIRNVAQQNAFTGLPSATTDVSNITDFEELRRQLAESL